ncbi:hypothetical protein IWZ03DRAFT_369935 [Phyllosticta citriasiana]|uniref:Uncharacterized protein n=1 Tax=Phyllosticta citriasiana TaxID=595635 RepID=A0ABR1KV21_9PEZI
MCRCTCMRALGLLLPSNTIGAFKESQEAAVRNARLFFRETDSQLTKHKPQIDEAVADGHLYIARGLAEQALCDCDLDSCSRARYHALLTVLPGEDPDFQF